MAQLGKLLAVCDIDSEKAIQFSKQYHCDYFTDCDGMIKAFPKADVVAICTPNYLHAQQSILCLKNNMHVLCEKPMAINTIDAMAMLQTANQYNKKLFIVKQNRFNPPVIAVKKLLQQHTLGNICSIQLACFWNRNDEYYHNSWKGTKHKDGGTLFTQFSHFIDLLYWYFGDVKTINAMVKNSNHQNSIEFEDNGVVALEFNNGIIGSINYSVNAFEKNMEGSLTILGEKGTVKIGGQYLNELSYQQIQHYQIPPLEKGKEPNNYGTYQGSMSNHEEVYKQVIDTIESSETNNTTNSFEAFKTVQIIERIYAAALQN
jgi:UDP-N-acetyl-2-amino-2-deoxyglucuronate dehydrogenase